MDRPDEDERPILSDWRKTGDGEWARQRDDVGTGPVWIRRVPHGYQWCVVWLGCSVAGGSQPIPPYGDGPAIMAAREAADAAALRWYRLPDEGPSRADIRPPASLAEAQEIARETLAHVEAGATPSFVEIKRLCELVIAMREGGK